MTHKYKGVVVSLKPLTNYRGKNKGGFGFIEMKNDVNDLFFHYSEVKDNKFAKLQEGDAVGIADIQDSVKGRIAIGVELLNDRA